jgi:biopolymer transport protein TolR
MAVRLNSGGVTHRYSRRRGQGRMSDINVTPLVDVMLVLLIVFMVTAPLLNSGVELTLPESEAPPLNQPEEPLVISVDKSGAIFIQETPVTLEALAPRLLAITQNKPDTTIYVRGDQSINYGRMIEVMGMLTGSGFTKLSLVTEAKDGAAAAPPEQPAGETQGN